MNTELEETKEKVALECGFDPINGTAWKELLNCIKGDVELIDFYMNVLVDAHTMDLKSMRS